MLQAVKDTAGWHGENRPPPDLVLIAGGASGADTLVKTLARTFRVTLEEYPADWKTYGRAAGPMRNQRMLDEGKPDAVLAMPGGRGTADMVRRAEKAGIRTIKYNDESGIVSCDGGP